MHADEPEFLHQPLDPLVADVLADLGEPGEDPSDAIAPLVLVEDGRDQPAQRTVTALAGAKGTRLSGVKPREETCSWAHMNTTVWAFFAPCSLMNANLTDSGSRRRQGYEGDPVTDFFKKSLSILTTRYSSRSRFSSARSFTSRGLSCTTPLSLALVTQLPKVDSPMPKSRAIWATG